MQHWIQRHTKHHPCVSLQQSAPANKHVYCPSVPAWSSAQFLLLRNPCSPNLCCKRTPTLPVVTSNLVIWTTCLCAWQSFCLVDDFHLGANDWPSAPWFQPTIPGWPHEDVSSCYSQSLLSSGLYEFAQILIFHSMKRLWGVCPNLHHCCKFITIQTVREVMVWQPSIQFYFYFNNLHPTILHQRWT